MRKLIKYCVSLLTVLVLVSTATPKFVSAMYMGSIYDPNTLLLMVNGEFNDSGQPVYKDGRLLVPIRTISEELNANVQFKSWDQPVVITLGKNKLQFTLGNKKAYINGKSVQLDVPAQTIENTAFVPIRLISDGLGVDVSWRQSDKILAVESKTIAGQTKLTTQSAQVALRKTIGNTLNLSANGVKYLHYYEFIAYKESSEYGINYLVDKYTGEVYTMKQNRSLENLTQEQVRKSIESQVQSLTKHLDISTPYLENGGKEVINGKKYYMFEVLYTRAEGPDYITTLLVDQNKKIAYMTGLDFENVAFTDSGFQVLATERVKLNSAYPSEPNWF